MPAVPAIHARDVTKEFGGVRVLDRVGLSVSRGEILGIIGENGAGKSTLAGILAGIHLPSAGTVRVEGRPARLNSPSAARRRGIYLVPQEFDLVDSLAVFENVFLGIELTRGPVLDRRRMKARTRAFLDELDADLDPDVRTGELSVAQKQMVEMAKALAHEARVLILDEPTTVLNAAEVERLFRVVRRLRDQGAAVLFVSHKLEEVRNLCDRVLILRDGVAVATVATADVTAEEMARRMVGRELGRVFPAKRRADGPVVLQVEDLAVAGLFHGVGFDLHAGEIVGMAGLVGSGRTEVAETLMGLRRPAAGEIRWRGVPVHVHTPRQAVDLGMAYLSEDRQGRGLLLDLDAAHNITLVSLRRYTRRGRLLLDRPREYAAAREYTRRFNIRLPSLRAPLRFLSGGNQQKVYLAKWMDTQPQVLILDEPTRGIDVEARTEIYRFIRSLADRGIACLVISSELEEIIGLCQRVVVMRQGTMATILEKDELSEEQIMYWATGVPGYAASGGPPS